MKRNLVGKILGKIKIFVQDFVPIRTALSTSYENFKMIPPQGGNYGRSLSYRTTISAAAAVDVQGRDSLLRTEVERRSLRGVLRTDIKSRIDPLLKHTVVGICIKR